MISSPDLGIDASFSRFKPSCVHRFLISGPDLGIDARISPFTPSCVHRFLISGPNLGIDAKKPSRTAQRLHRFLISSPDLGIDARISPKTTFCVHRFLISGPNLGIDAAPSLRHRRTARLQHGCLGAGGDRVPRRRHNPKKKAAGVAPVPAVSTLCVRI